MNGTGDVLATARWASGWSREGLAAAAEVGVEDLVRYEDGEQAPDDGALRRLARALGVTPALVRRAARATGLSTSADPHLRVLPVDAELRQTLAARLDMIGLHMATLGDAIRIGAEIRLPTFNPDTDPTTAARLVRAQWRLPAERMPQLASWLDGAAVLIVEQDLGAGNAVQSLSRWYDDHAVILLAAELPTDQKRWALAHEVGHLTMHGAGTGAGAAAEQQADDFAAELLTPVDEIAPVLEAWVTAGRLVSLKRCWGVSLNRLIARADGLGAFTPHERATLIRQLDARNMLADEPASEDLPPEVPWMASHIAESLAALGLTPADIAHAAGFASAEANTIFVAEPQPADPQPAEPQFQPV